jgi:hypothetical protein
MAKVRGKKQKKHELELPLWLVVFMTFVFVITWFLMSHASFFSIMSFPFWIIMTMAFLIPVLVIWLIYFKVIDF